MAPEAAPQEQVVTPPWRDVATEFDDAIEPEKARRKAGLNIKVAGKDLFWDNDGRRVKVPRQKAIVRTDNDTFLASMGENYPVVQFEESFEPLDTLVEAKNARYIAAGTFSEGRVGYMVAELPGTMKVGGSDPVAKHVIAMASHDGSVSSHIAIMPFRIASQTILPGGLRKQDLDLTVHHRSNVASRMKEVEKLLGTVSRQFDAFKDLADDLFRIRFSDDRMKKVAERVFPGEVGAKLNMARDRLVELFNESGPAAGTAWGALCAVCEYVDHERTTRVAGRQRDENGVKEREARLASTLFGKSYRLKFDTVDFVRALAKV